MPEKIWGRAHSAIPWEFPSHHGPRFDGAFPGGPPPPHCGNLLDPSPQQVQCLSGENSEASAW